MNERWFDIVREVINIGVGDAASALSDLVNSRITITIPEVRVMNTAEAPEFVRRTLAPLGVYISQDFGGPVSGKALLAYPRQSARAIVNALTGRTGAFSSLSQTEMAVLQEVGNILMVSCLSTMSNVMDASLSFKIPQVTEDISDAYFENMVKELAGLDKAIVVKNEMVIEAHRVSGYLFIFLGFRDFQTVIERLDRQTAGA